MIAHCRHNVPFDATCAACEAEVNAWDPASIGRIVETYENLASALERRARGDDLERAARYRSNAFAYALDLWQRDARTWQRLHPVELADLGGESA